MGLGMVFWFNIDMGPELDKRKPQQQSIILDCCLFTTTLEFHPFVIHQIQNNTSTFSLRPLQLWKHT